MNNHLVDVNRLNVLRAPNEAIKIDIRHIEQLILGFDLPDIFSTIWLNEGFGYEENVDRRIHQTNTCIASDLTDYLK